MEQEQKAKTSPKEEANRYLRNEGKMAEIRNKLHCLNEDITTKPDPTEE